MMSYIFFMGNRYFLRNALANKQHLTGYLHPSGKAITPEDSLLVFFHFKLQGIAVVQSILAKNDGMRLTQFLIMDRNSLFP